MGKPTLSLAFYMALVSGVAWFAWSAHDFGSSCGIRLPGYPSGPTTTGDILLIAIPAILVTAVHLMRTRSWLGALGYGVGAAVLAGSAVMIAVFLWVASRHCGE